MPSQQSPPNPGQLDRLGRYRLIRPLSKGGMALVYEGRRESLAGVAPRVAVKIILPDYAESATFKELFINEARLGASMHHQNLVQIQDFDYDGDARTYFLVMEYVEGITLRKAISVCKRAGVQIPLKVIAEFGRQACDGLHYAHRARDESGRHLALVHRDIKPSNLILNPQGVIKVLDFGISKGILQPERKGAVRGTWGYMAPEQADGRDVGPTTDVFGLALVLTELARLAPVFPTRDQTKIKQLLADDHAARSVSTLDPMYRDLQAVLTRALQRDPRARFPNATEFGRSLSALLADPISARDEVTHFYETVQAVEQGRRVQPPPVVHPSGSIVPASSESADETVSASWVIGGVAAAGLAVVVLVATIVAVIVGVQMFGGDELTSELAPTPVEVSPKPEERPLDEPAGPAGEDAPGEAPVEPAVTPPPPRPVPKTSVGPRPAPEVEQPVAVDEVVDKPKTVIVIRDEPEPEPEPVEPPAEPVLETTEPEPAEEQVEGVGQLTVSALPPGLVYDVYVDGQFVKKGPFVRREFPAGRHFVTISATNGRRHRFEVILKPDQELKRVWDFNRNEWRR